MSISLYIGDSFFNPPVIQRCATSVIPVPQYLANAGSHVADSSTEHASAGAPKKPMTYLISYVAVLVVFGIIDAGWLNTMGKLLYRPTLDDILLDDLRIAPAVMFYLIYPVGVVAFAVLPGLHADSVITAFCYALLFGALAYGTYDLTNYATLRNWTLQITAIDICYGALASGIAATMAMLVARAFVQ
jgi:uncharacterized membrane protein